jgi:hypothetical protein
MLKILKIDINIFTRFTIALLCFESRSFVYFEISDIIIGEYSFEGERELCVCQKGARVETG